MVRVIGSGFGAIGLNRNGLRQQREFALGVD
jgi:hypothetical protein